jgi:predicted dehydrogenase
LPGFAKSKYAKPVALVSGDRAKALKIVAQYGIKESSFYDYQSYDRLADNPDIQVIYIVLPNSMHKEFVLRGAKAGKHSLCEKPMATSSRDCETMTAACKAANVKLMIAYRQQYEPMNRAILKMVREGKLGALRSFVATNSQNEGDPSQWRQKLAPADGGCLPDVGIYCLNAARFLSKEEPTEVWGTIYQPKNDPRFAEVEATCSFTAIFPSGLIATCNAGYAAHRSQFMRMEGDKSWVEMSPAFAYTGLKLKVRELKDGKGTIFEPTIEAADQFAAEMDHMSLSVQQNVQPDTPGEEWLQDQRIVEAIYESARTGRAVKLSPPPGATRGPDPTEP